MDDGLQNPGLQKDFKIAVVDGSRGVGNGQIIPSGPLRAPLNAQLQITDAAVIYGEAPPDLKKILHAAQIPTFEATAAPAGDLEWIRKKPILAFAGIGNPQRFFKLLEKLGGQIIETRCFPDHHAYSQSDTEDLLSRAKYLNAQLATTEKDLVRFDPTTCSEHEQIILHARILPIRTLFSLSLIHI